MTKRSESDSSHIEPAILAALADPADEPWLDDEVAAHVANCRYCLAVYAEFSRTHIQEALAAETDGPSVELLAAARRIATKPSERLRRSGSSGRRIGVILTAGTIAAGVAIAALLWRDQQKDSQAYAVDQGLRDVIAVHLREDSYKSLLYAADLVPQPRGTRGEFGTQASELAPLMNMWSDGRPSADLAYWLIAGLLAEGHYREADPYLRQAIERFSGEARFHNLAAIQAYKFSHLATAEVELRRALNLGDDVSHVLNLARILEEEGRLTEAQELLDQLVERHSNAPVAFLARDRSQYRSNP